MKTELGNGTADQIEAVSGFLTKTAKVTVDKDATQLQFLGHCYAKGLRSCTLENLSTLTG